MFHSGERESLHRKERGATGRRVTAGRRTLTQEILGAGGVTREAADRKGVLI